MEYFNSRFSLLKFFRDVIGTPYNLRVFANDPKLPTDEDEMAAAETYLHLTIQRGEYRVIQPIDLTLALYQRLSFDATANWLKTMQQVISHLAATEKTDTEMNLVALYDYDALIGSSAITTFLTTGAYPATLATILATEPPTLTRYEANGIPSGLFLYPDRREPLIRTDSDPCFAIWHLTARFHAPTHTGRA